MVSEISFERATSADLPSLFDCYKQGMRQIVDEAFGWDEDFQRNGFTTKLDINGFQWLLIDQKRIGFVCVDEDKKNLKLNFIVLFADNQQKGLGEVYMKMLLAEAHVKRKSIVLSCFKNNHRAINLYKRLDFSLTDETQYFFHFESSLLLA
ncbi:hypothetical protein CS022_23810 [Veronia nyctiphanis]|uniref:N-acetyltransferase domain-containing protein n=1 Tax=Veronia nyctiphanis TaxID=1278244 RepID=A0A4Q0YFX7_9GAMM|nr:hypothetical protein CS022_23810 [Veronia nyctiphanis]